MSNYFSVYGIPIEDQKKLKILAKKLFGKPSISFLAKQLLLEKINTECEFQKIQLQEDNPERIEVRLQNSDLQELKKRARQSNMTANRYLSMLFQAHIMQKPILSTKEVEALYQSNAQLLRIGRNLNQIAKALNTGSQTAISTSMLNNIKNELDIHTEKVADIIRANWERMP